jgi:hypothetical protein
MQDSVVISGKGIRIFVNQLFRHNRAAIVRQGWFRRNVSKARLLLDKLSLA